MLKMTRWVCRACGHENKRGAFCAKCKTLKFLLGAVDLPANYVQVLAMTRYLEPAIDMHHQLSVKFSKDEPDMLDTLVFMLTHRHGDGAMYIEFPYRAYQFEARAIFDNMVDFCETLDTDAHLMDTLPDKRLDSYLLMGGVPVKPKSVDVQIDVSWNDPLNPESRGKFYVFTSDVYDQVDIFSDLFQERVRLRCTRRGMPSPMSVWYTEAFQRAFLPQFVAGGGFTPRLLADSLQLHANRELFTRVQWSECTKFKPSFAIFVVKLLFGPLPVKWLDISAGWGDRAGAAVALKTEKYVGYDPNTDLEPGHNKILDLDRSVDASIIYKPFEFAELEPESFNLVFSSPPYFDLEAYSSLPGQSTDSHKTFEKWLRGFFLASIDKAWAALEQGGYLAMHIVDQPGMLVVDPMIRRVAELGGDFMGVLFSFGMASGRSQPTWVFIKP